MKVFTFAGFLAISLLLVPGVFATNNPVYSGASPANNSKVYNTDIIYSISYTNVSNVTGAIFSLRLPTESVFTNITVVNVDNTTANISRTTSFSGTITYIWYINSSETSTFYNVTDPYTFQTAKLTALFMTLAEMPAIVTNFLTIIVVFVPVILLIAVIGLLRGWFGDLKGVLNFKKMGRIK